MYKVTFAENNTKEYPLTVLQTKAQTSPAYSVTQNAFITPHDVNSGDAAPKHLSITTNASVQACKSKCDATPWCTSFDIRNVQSQLATVCYLSDVENTHILARKFPSMCPASHPYTFASKRFCCKTNKERNSTQGSGCDGSALSEQSTSRMLNTGGP